MNIRQKLDKEISTFVGQAESPGRSFKRKKKVTYSEFLSDKMLMIQLIRRGMPYSLFSLIKDVTPFSDDNWAEILNVSPKSLHRYKQSSKQFKPLQSEKIVEIAEVTEAGVEVFGDIERFSLWLNTPNFALGGMKPFELLKDSYGKELVQTELTRIGHGILA